MAFAVRSLSPVNMTTSSPCSFSKRIASGAVSLIVSATAITPMYTPFTEISWPFFRFFHIMRAFLPLVGYQYDYPPSTFVFPRIRDRRLQLHGYRDRVLLQSHLHQ